jgi:hypothetical protein
VAGNQVAGNDVAEDRLRELLRDPAWSIPPWPDAHARVRAAARRQRRNVTSLAAAAGASAAMAALVTGALAGGWPHAARSALSSPAISNGLVLPVLGAAGFPSALYPVASSRRGARVASHCPNAAGLVAPPPSMPAETVAVVDQLGRSFESDLRLSDRAYWPQALAQWESGAPAATAAPTVDYSGPLSASPAWGPAALPRDVRSACGNLIARYSWLLVASPAGRPSAQTDYLLLDRAGHVLVWDEQTGA